VARWLPERLDEAAARRNYAPRIAGESPVRVHMAVIGSYVRDVVLPARPAARSVVASPDVANARSVRALAKAGFARAEVLDRPGEPGPQQRCVLDLVKFFGRPEG
jgi:hypothetical protein